MRNLSTTVHSIILFALFGGIIIGCVSPKAPFYVSGSDPEIERLKSTMKRDDALNRVKKALTEYTYSLNCGEPTNRFYCKAEITRFGDDGFSFVEQGAIRLSGVKQVSFNVDSPEFRLLMRHKKLETETFAITNVISFSSFTHVDGYRRSGMPCTVWFYCGTNSDAFHFKVDVENAKELYEETMAAMEILCTNLTSLSSK